MRTLRPLLFIVLASCTKLPSGSAYETDGSAAPEAGPTHDASSTGAAHDADAQSGAEERTRQPLIGLTDLRLVLDPSRDPLAQHRPDPVGCEEHGFYVEADALEIDTGACTYASLVAPALVAVNAGQQLAIRANHYDLHAAEAAQAHVALFAGSQLLWETYVDIPSRAGVLDQPFKATTSFAAGTPITFHLHNHGQNTWRLQGVDLMVPAP